MPRFFCDVFFLAMMVSRKALVVKKKSRFAAYLQNKYSEFRMFDNLVAKTYLPSQGHLCRGEFFNG